MGFTRSRRLTRFVVHMQAFGRVLRRPHSVTAYTANTASAYERGYAAAAPDVNASAVENAGTESDFACAAAGNAEPVSVGIKDAFRTTTHFSVERRKPKGCSINGFRLFVCFVLAHRL